MSFGLCNLNSVPVRREHDDRSEMVTQLLFGDHISIIDSWNQWRKIKITQDGYEGWIDQKQFHPLSHVESQAYLDKPNAFLSDLVGYLIDQNQALIAISTGANLKAVPYLNLEYDDQIQFLSQKLEGAQLVEIALNYLNTPYLWGGKTPFGIDCSGLTQIVYRIGGYPLSRDASQQALQGEVLSFLEESQPGDLAFFDNQEGEIIHVGILMGDHHILHAHGKVRIDLIDHTGIFNQETKRYSHQLRLIKRVLD